MRKPFLDLVRERVVVLDGAMGSNLQTRPLDVQRDWMGHENISEVLNFTRPEVIQEIHEAFLAVGCDAVETNTFGANKIVLAEAETVQRTLYADLQTGGAAAGKRPKKRVPRRGEQRSPGRHSAARSAARSRKERNPVIREIL